MLTRFPSRLHQMVNPLLILNSVQPAEIAQVAWLDEAAASSIPRRPRYAVDAGKSDGMPDAPVAGVETCSFAAALPTVRCAGTDDETLGRLRMGARPPVRALRALANTMVGLLVLEGGNAGLPRSAWR
ncbi:hypothetical protein [Streptomyces sp. NPDC086989]|uniref:hypothetical protein n=1 Tax=Streptomyces sp. NPDC086989 TaxID=3365764 RepID=UPI0038302A25